MSINCLPNCRMLCDVCIRLDLWTCWCQLIWNGDIHVHVYVWICCSLATLMCLYYLLVWSRHIGELACFYTFNKGIITMLFYTDVISNINVTLICLFVICEKVQWNQTKITCRHYNLKVSHFLQQKKFFLGSECCYL